MERPELSEVLKLVAKSLICLDLLQRWRQDPLWWQEPSAAFMQNRGVNHILEPADRCCHRKCIKRTVEMQKRWWFLAFPFGTFSSRLETTGFDRGSPTVATFGNLAKRKSQVVYLPRSS